MPKYNGHDYTEIYSVFGFDPNPDNDEDDEKLLEKVKDRIVEIAFSCAESNIEDIPEAKEIRSFLKALEKAGGNCLQSFYAGMEGIEDDWTLLRVFAFNLEFCWT